MAESAATIEHAETETLRAQHDSIVAVYASHASAEVAVRALADSGFDMQKLSIIGRDYTTEEGVVGFYNAGDRMKAWAKTGAFWGGLWGTLFGSALFVVPGLGPLFAAGPLVGRIVGALEGAAIGGGMGAVGAGLYSIGIPKDSIPVFKRQLKGGKFILIAHGSCSDIEISRSILADAEHMSGTTDECCA
jgi:hypothetical protein